MSYFGFVALGSTLKGLVVTKNASGTPTDSSPAPTFRCYGPGGFLASGSLTLKDPGPSGGAITGATNATPIVITSVGHNLNTGTFVTISGVGGNTAANGNWQITVIDPNTFSLNTSVGNGAYTSGGTWHVAGLYEVSITPQGVNGFVQGTTYSVLVTSIVGGTTMAEIHTFTVV